jgi:hypothetical protein
MTIGEWLEKLSASDSSTEEDSRVLQNALRSKKSVGCYQTH